LSPLFCACLRSSATLSCSIIAFLSQNAFYLSLRVIRPFELRVLLRRFAASFRLRVVQGFS
jgi:hypothetical protein